MHTTTPVARRPLSIIDFASLLFLGAVWGAAFLFLRIAAPEVGPAWAAEINQYWTLIDPYWWMTLFPALAIASLVVAVNLVADGIREAYER